MGLLIASRTDYQISYCTRSKSLNLSNFLVLASLGCHLDDLRSSPSGFQKAASYCDLCKRDFLVVSPGTVHSYYSWSPSF